EVDAFNAMMAEEAPGTPQLRPAVAPAQPFAVPVTFLQPDTERNRRALGYDMFSEEVRRAAMVEAQRTARPTASGKVLLEQEGGVDAPGFLIYMTFFTANEAGRELKGFIYSPFNAEDFLASALEVEEPGYHGIRLYDRQASPDNLLAEIDGDGEFNGSYRET